MLDIKVVLHWSWVQHKVFVTFDNEAFIKDGTTSFLRILLKCHLCCTQISF